jgi:hypothetical protein
MLVAVCLIGSNLNIHAKPEKLHHKDNLHLRLSPKGYNGWPHATTFTIYGVSCLTVLLPPDL